MKPFQFGVQTEIKPIYLSDLLCCLFLWPCLGDTIAINLKIGRNRLNDDF